MMKKKKVNVAVEKGFGKNDLLTTSGPSSRPEQEAEPEISDMQVSLKLKLTQCSFPKITSNMLTIYNNSQRYLDIDNFNEV